jgi:hypothetical protein
VYEPIGGIVTHHVQYRQEDATRKRMELLGGATGRNDFNNSIGNTEIRSRLLSLDAVYSQRWGDVDNLVAKGPDAPDRSRARRAGVRPVPWTGTPSARWYGAEDLERAKAAWAADHRRPTPTDGADAGPDPRATPTHR